MEATTEATTAGARFVEHFKQGWAIGGTDPERFFAHFGPLFQPDARFIQPLAPTAVGVEGLKQVFMPIFEIVPLTSVVHRWAETEDGVFIEHTLSGDLGGKHLSWTATDRITLRDGLLAERVAYFDPLPLVLALLSRPWLTYKLLPSLLNRKERR